MENWRKLFKPWILVRGQEYYECGQVVALKELDSAVTAEVSGSKAYRVEIHRFGDRVTRVLCDCPYAAEGENCKHMAAVLFALEEKTAQARMDWQEALEQMEESQLRALLHSLAAENGTLQDRIVRMVAGPGDDPVRWQNELAQIVSDHTDYRGRLDYGQAYDCMIEVAEYLEECLPQLLNGGQVVDAAKLVMTVYGTAWGQDMDDSDGGLTIVSHRCREALEKILRLTDKQQEREIFELLHDFLEDSNWDYGSDDWEDLLLSLDWSSELQQKNLEYLDDDPDPQRMEKRAELMERMGVSKAEVIAWWEQRRDDDCAYRPLLRLYGEEDLPKAIALVRDKRKRENTPWCLVKDTKVLLELLKKAGKQEEYDTELRYLVLELKCQETEFVSQLKKITSSEKWPAVFQKLLIEAKRPADRIRLYRLNGMYSELYAELEQYPHIGTFQSYEEELRRWNTDRTRMLYVQILKREMESACDRKQYRQTVAYLKGLSKYPNGKEEVEMLAAYWYIAHKNRRAMKEELKKAGYPQE